MIRVFVLLILFAIVGKISGQEYDENNQEELKYFDNDKLVEETTIEDDSESEMDGMLLDETISKIGRDFFNSFFMKWQKPSNAKDFSITIQEKPIVGIGSRILIYLNDLTIFDNVIQPRAEIIEDYVDYAITMVNTYWENYEAIQQQLQGEDLSGTGIF